MNRAVLFPAAALILSSCGYNAETETFFALDTAVTVVSADKAAITAAKEAIMEADRTFSKVCGEYAPLSAEDADRINFCIDRAAALNSRYNGKTDLFCGLITALWGISGDSPRVPSESEILSVLDETAEMGIYSVSEGGTYTGLDLGAAAKGCAVDMAYEAVSDMDIRGYITVSAGSSSLLYGEKEGGFKVAVRSPDGGEEILGGFVIPDGFVSTSGGYERFFEADGKRYSHIFDTKTGYPIDTDLVSVTVVIPLEENGGLNSDLLSTMIYCGGTAELKKFADDDICFIAADVNKNVYVNGIGFEINESGGYVCLNVN